MSTHTPGPWRANLTRGKQGYSDSYNVSGPQYAICRMMGIDNEDKANALLVATAPDLLEAAKEVLDFRSWIVSACPPEIRTAVRSVFTPLADAIAKAEETPENKTP